MLHRFGNDLTFGGCDTPNATPSLLVEGLRASLETPCRGFSLVSPPLDTPKGVSWFGGFTPSLV